MAQRGWASQPKWVLISVLDCDSQLDPASSGTYAKWAVHAKPRTLFTGSGDQHCRVNSTVI